MLTDGIITTTYTNIVKNKIHCSCPLCRAKTGKRKSLGTNQKNWSIPDEKRIEEMQDQLLDNE